ncbi:ABC-type sugar transport system, permease component [Treponema bryantii]|uniref:ABC-type sugar transport system, permease component n=1 Tax=Treponema bryantii TaxID=163 RepID=A0A1H8ZPE4_9SPIR|nr:sugar ABC transporter permease [Treponema bryantii]BDC93967.1 lactose ABC transporter permease [Treponema bryantii]SEP65538.1 ABC-type sugar transport system, permease component [Treponema bryantii]
MKKKVGLMGRRAVYGYLFILPFILGFVFFMIKPLAQSLHMAMSEVVISNQGFQLNWNNFDNFKKALLVDAEFNRMLVEAIGQMVLRSAATIVFSFFVALLLNQKFKGRTLARSIFFLAVILSSGVLVGLESSNALMAQLKEMIEESGNANTITDVLEKILVSEGSGVNGISGKAFKTVFEIIDSIYDVAMASGIQIIIFLSGLQNISPSMYEAAQMEGCTAWESLWKITVPMVSPLMLVCWIYTIVDFFMKSDNQIMTKINTQMTELLNYGFSSAMAWIYFVVCMALIGISSLIISKVVYNYD